ncbi:MAG: hypothetical protein ABJE47_07350 [bacterium]
MLRRLAFAVVATLLAGTAPSRAVGAQQEARAFNVYLDCNGFYCDEEFFRTEIVSVNWVRERTAADVHILGTSQPTGGGGARYSLAFIGQRRFNGIIDTLTYDAPQSNSSDDTRRGLARTLKLGLVRYLARTSAAERLAVTYTAGKGTDSSDAAATHDPWDAWVFSLNASGNDSREESYSNLYMNGRVSANRVTDAWKTTLSVGENYSESRFTFDDAQSVFIQRSYSADLLQVKSLDAHWSAGLKGSFNSSTYLNQRAASRLTPEIEYDLYPYAEATRRQLRLQYGLGISAFSYYDTTVFNKVRETLPVQVFSTAFSQNETWGSVNAGVDAVSYLSDLSRRRLTYSAGANIRIVKGLSVNFFGDYESIHDQFYIPKEGITRDDALLRQSQQSTRFSQFFFVGLTYSFGSVLNNVVNPRFGNSGGGGMMIIQ